MEDDTKLKIIFYTGIILSIIAVIGVWENIVRPIILFATNNIHISGISQLFAGVF